MVWKPQPDGSWYDDATGRTAPAGSNPLSLGSSTMAPLEGSPEAAALASGQTPGTGAPATGGTPGTTSGTAPYTGFAARYTPGTLKGTIYDNPFFILRDVFNGINESSPGYQALRDFGGDPLALFNVMAGANGTIAESDQGAGAFVNFLADLYRNLGTPGGQDFDSQQLLRNIFSQEPGTSKTTLGNILAAGDMGTQIRTLFGLLRDVSGVSMNPLAASAYQAAIARAGDRYGNEQINRGAGDTTSMVDYIKQNMPWLAVT